jgi:hypothetical protein
VTHTYTGIGIKDPMVKAVLGVDESLPSDLDQNLTIQLSQP